jgi:predicted transcriptional regulator
MEAIMMKRTVKDIMNPRVVTVTDTMVLREAAQILVEEGITGAPVVDDLGTLVGVISQSDLVEHAVATAHELTIEAPFYRRPYDDVIRPDRSLPLAERSTELVKDVMTPFLVTVAEDIPIQEVAARMAKCGIHRLIVVDADQDICGIVTSMDVLQWVADLPGA